MALQVWLPLNGNLKNNGLFPTKPINYGATVNNFGKIGSCYLFDGVDDYLDSGYGESVSNQNLTITMWIKPITIGNSKIIFGADNGNNQRLYVGIYNGVYSLGFGKQPWKGTASIGPVINRWDFIAVVVNKNTASLYCNGQFVESITDSVFSFVSNFFIGGRSDGLNSNILANDFRIYDEVLSVKQIKEINKCLLAHYSLEGPGGN